MPEELRRKILGRKIEGKKMKGKQEGQGHERRRNGTACQVTDSLKIHSSYFPAIIFLASMLMFNQSRKLHTP